MDTARSTPAPARPHFVTTSHGQLRVWTLGSGPAVIVLPGLLKSPGQRACECAERLPGCHVIAVELPGLGASSAGTGPALQIAEAALRSWIDGLDQPVALLAFDLAGPLAARLSMLCPRIATRLWLESDRHQQAQDAFSPLQGLELQWDGTHLVRLWSHLRDQDMRDPARPLRARTEGPPYLSAEELDDALLCFGQDTAQYQALWNALAQASPEVGRGIARGDFSHAEALADFGLRTAPLGRLSAAMPAQGIVRQYVDVSRGRVHLRRAGHGPQLLLAFLAGAGSSANLDPLLAGLADRFTVVAPDYIGQGGGLLVFSAISDGTQS